MAAWRLGSRSAACIAGGSSKKCGASGWRIGGAAKRNREMAGASWRIGAESEMCAWRKRSASRHGALMRGGASAMKINEAFSHI
jgi:hypothetical protein